MIHTGARRICISRRGRWHRRGGVRLLVLLGAALAYPGHPAAQTPSLQDRLAAATRLSCTFTTIVTGTWKAGLAAAEVKTTRLELGFENINVDDGTADQVGRFGESNIVVRSSAIYMHLLQMQGAGPLYTTTVFAKPTTEGRLMAVHTRHEYTDVSMPGYTSRPEMYVGDCVVGD